MNWLSILSFIHTLTHITLSFINHSFCNMCKNTHTHYWLLISNRFECNLGTSCPHRQTSTPDTTSSPSDRMKGGCGAPAPRCRLSDNFGIGHGHLRDGIFFCNLSVRLLSDWIKQTFLSQNLILWCKQRGWSQWPPKAASSDPASVLVLSYVGTSGCKASYPQYSCKTGRSHAWGSPHSTGPFWPPRQTQGCLSFFKSWWSDKDSWFSVRQIQKN